MVARAAAAPERLNDGAGGTKSPAPMEFGMWVLFAHAPPPDAPYWPGRRWLSAVDAVVWPGAAWYWIGKSVGSGGIVLALVMALLVVSGVRRLFTALLVNHRYEFTTWRWGRALVSVLVVGTLLKVGVPA
jgi:hypothetical protein